MFFEDYEIGQVFDDQLEDVILSEEEIIDNAKAFDPRPIHIDKQAAKESRFGGIISSGLYSAMAFWGAWVRSGLDMDGIVAGVEVKSIRWLRPVYPETKYNIRVEVIDKKPRSSGKDGLVTYKMEATDPKGNLVLDFVVVGLVLKKQA
ncbi:MAG: MaoC/PaaZ C-terminal domain-containing protein [Anaerococcus sp.]|nr:MaoC/PaaZ C-terminal domain-containing protein [Anaerococcus sp.]